MHKLAELWGVFPFEVSVTEKYAYETVEFGNADILHFAFFVSFVQLRRANLLLLCALFQKIHSILDVAQIQDKHTQEK